MSVIERCCQQPSAQYMQLLEESGGDHRSVAGIYAIKRAGALAEKGWQPDYDARDARSNSRPFVEKLLILKVGE